MLDVRRRRRRGDRHPPRHARRLRRARAARPASTCSSRSRSRSTRDELAARARRPARSAAGVLMVGFNRRFAPLAVDAARRARRPRPAGGRLPRQRRAAAALALDARPAGRRRPHRRRGLPLRRLRGIPRAAARPPRASALAVGGSSEPREDTSPPTLGVRRRLVVDRSPTRALGDPALAKERVEVLGRGRRRRARRLPRADAAPRRRDEDHERPRATRATPPSSSAFVEAVPDGRAAQDRRRRCVAVMPRDLRRSATRVHGVAGRRAA